MILTKRFITVLEEFKVMEECRLSTDKEMRAKVEDIKMVSDRTAFKAKYIEIASLNMKSHLLLQDIGSKAVVLREIDTLMTLSGDKLVLDDAQRELYDSFGKEPYNYYAVVDSKVVPVNPEMDKSILEKHAAGVSDEQIDKAMLQSKAS